MQKLQWLQPVILTCGLVRSHMGKSPWPFPSIFAYCKQLISGGRNSLGNRLQLTSATDTGIGNQKSGVHQVGYALPAIQSSDPVQQLSLLIQSTIQSSE